MLYQNLSEQSSQDLTESQLNQFIGKLEEHKQMLRTEEEEQLEENQLQPLIYNTLMLEYDIFLGEEELKYYKVILADKQAEIKKMKDLHNKKASKFTSLADQIRSIDKRIKDVNDGYRLMHQKKQDYSRSQQTHRKQRLACQQKKNQLYQRYLELEEKNNNICAQIQQYEVYESDHSQMQNENLQLREQIEKLEKRKKALDCGTPRARKQQLKCEVKRLYQKIKMAQKEEQRVCKEYEGRKKKLKSLEQEQNSIGQRNIELNSLYSRLADLKDECQQRKWIKAEREKQYHEILSEESQLKRQLSKLQQHQIKKRAEEKKNFVHNFRIIDSEADQQLVRGSKQLRSNSNQQQSVNSDEQFDELIGRFQQIKSKSKHLS